MIIIAFKSNNNNHNKRNVNVYNNYELKRGTANCTIQ